MRVYFKAQNIEFSAKRIFIDELGGMAYGLFASLLIGTIISTVGTYLFTGLSRAIFWARLRARH